MQLSDPRPLTTEDFHRIVRVIDHWWGGPTGALAHPIFFHELGAMARVLEDRGAMVAFILGFLTPPDNEVAYIHLVGIHPTYRRRGLGKLLYQYFETEACKLGAKRAKAITNPGNEGSCLFHEAVGWTRRDEKDYAGPGRHRIVFEKSLG